MDTPTEPVRDELIKRYIGFARSIAINEFRKIKSSCPLDDMINAAYLAMIETFDRFKATGHSKYGKQFEIYSAFRIKGSCIDAHWKYNNGTKSTGHNTCPEGFEFDEMVCEESPEREEEYGSLYQRVVVDNEFDLSESNLRVINDHIVHGMDFHTIASSLDMDFNKARQLMYRGIAKIRKNVCAK